MLLQQRLLRMMAQVGWESGGTRLPLPAGIREKSYTVCCFTLIGNRLCA
jgi:hypothetical protein